LPTIESFNLNKEIYEISNKKYKHTLSELVELLEVEDQLKVQVRKLSLGQRMKMELIAALLHSPKILFLDEPTIGLDVVMQKKMRDFIKDYNLRYKSTILLTSQHMDDVKELCDRVVIIDKGKLLFDGALDEIIKKFANHKLITVVFSSDVDKSALEKIGQVKEFEPPKAVISVKRNATSMAASALLQNMPVADLNIEEPQIEDIIREVFTGKDVS
jgi:ABC-2 type transport system ATP-binding protein